MTEPVTDADGDNYVLYPQFPTVNDETHVSHFVSGSEVALVETMTPESKCITTNFNSPEGWIVEKNSCNTGTTIDSITPESMCITTNFTLPEGWTVEKKPRITGTRIDSYYRDPETGRKFRSIREVERYLREGVIPTTSNLKRLKCYEKDVQSSTSRKNIISLGKIQDFEENEDSQCQLIKRPSRFLSTPPFKLPAGWVVKEVPRKGNLNHVDRYYFEPGTGNMFRSLISVQKHLAELEEGPPLALEDLGEDNIPLSKAYKVANSIKNYNAYDSWKKNISKKEQDSSSSNAPPKKINWVIPSTRGETWNAYIGDELVPDSVKQLWGKRLMFVIKNTKRNEQV